VLDWPNRFFMPTQMEVGKGLAQKIGEMLKPYNHKNILIVTDKGLLQAGILKPIEKSLEEHGIQYVLYDEVEPNPSAQIAHRGSDVAKEYGCDAILGVGGGSSIDTAKGIAALVTNKGNILNFEGVGKLSEPALPIYAIPTTAGTGSEGTASAVFTNKETLYKAVIISPYLYPKLAILDPLLMVELPASITAATGMDALTHAIESYTSKGANSMSQGLAIHAVKMIRENLLKTYFVGTDIESRENMLVASMIAGVAFAQSRLGNVHAISHTFGGVFNIPHGIANATLLPYVLQFNLPACPEKMRDIAVALGKDVSGLTPLAAAEKAVEAVVEMNEALGIPKTIKELGVTLDYLPQMVSDAMKSGNILANPRLTKANDVQMIIENAYHGVLT